MVNLQQRVDEARICGGFRWGRSLAGSAEVAQRVDQAEVGMWTESVELEIADRLSLVLVAQRVVTLKTH